MSAIDHDGCCFDSWIDNEAANDPERICLEIAGIPGTESVRVTADQLANAINRAAWWLEETLGGRGNKFPTVAYTGISDLRYLILVVAGVKTGYKVGQPAHDKGLGVDICVGFP